jgi:methylmalonyl-CoA/ethylmalonyl-CoA epimerase
MHESFRLHHIGILVADIDRSRDLLVQRFGYVAETGLIEDAQQTAFGQFLRLPGADHWTELVAPNGPNSVLRGALDRKRGGTHHLCYEVPDVDAACQRLHDLAMNVISTPKPGTAFGGRRIAWVIDRDYLLIELVEAGPGPLALPARDAGRGARDAR